jgi:hypothetical protein
MGVKWEWWGLEFVVEREGGEGGSSLHSPTYSWRIPGLPGRTTRNPPGILVILPTAIVHQMFHSWLFFLQGDS